MMTFIHCIFDVEDVLTFDPTVHPPTRDTEHQAVVERLQQDCCVGAVWRLQPGTGEGVWSGQLYVSVPFLIRLTK